MGITIRDADLQADREEIIRFLHENLTADSDAARFDWLYFKNPFGRARAWMAVDTSGRMVGLAAAFPRFFSIAGTTQRTWVLGDFCFDRAYRSLGPALQLQRLSLKSLTADEHAICYDFPSQTMMSIYNRLGVRALGTHVRFVKMLSCDEKIQKLVSQRFLARSLSRVGNWALRFGQRPAYLPEGIELSRQDREFGEEFTAMSSRAASLHPIKAAHSAAYLNWRYVHHPVKQFCSVAARRESELLGYAVAEIDGRHSMLAELHAADTTCLRPLLAYLELLLRDLNVFSIYTYVLQDCHLVPHLRRAGFHPRDGAPVVAYTSSASKWHIDIGDAKNWMLLLGDRDS
jgi:hypothetical protein